MACADNDVIAWTSSSSTSSPRSDCHVPAILVLVVRARAARLRACVREWVCVHRLDVWRPLTSLSWLIHVTSGRVLKMSRAERDGAVYDREPTQAAPCSAVYSCIVVRLRYIEVRSGPSVRQRTIHCRSPLAAHPGSQSSDKKLKFITASLTHTHTHSCNHAMRLVSYWSPETARRRFDFSASI